MTEKIKILPLLLLLPLLAQSQSLPTPTGNTLVPLVEGNNSWRGTLNSIISGRVGPDSTWVKYSGSYLNKRIGDNVYRYGTTSLRTSDTSGILNIYGNSTTKPGLYLKYNDASTNGLLFFQLDPDNQTDNSSLGNFNFWAVNFPGANTPYSSRANHVWRMGYNTAQGGGRVLSTDADLHIAFESNFYNVFTTGRRKRSWEFHIQSQDTLNGVHRMLSMIGSHDGKDAEAAYSINRFTLQPYSISGSYFDMDYITKTCYIDTMQFLFQAPQVGYPFFSFRNAANSAYLKMFQSDASNRLVLNPDANDLYTYAPNLIFNTLGSVTTSDGNPVQIGGSSLKSWLLVNALGPTVAQFKTSTQTTAWSHLVYDSYYALNNPSGNALLYLHESGPNVMLSSDASGNIGFLTASPQARLHVYTASGATQKMLRVENSTGTNDIFRSNATPEGAITANQGDLALTNISSSGNLWVKRTGTGNTGWVPIGNDLVYNGSRALPTTVNNTIWLGVFVKGSNGGNNFDLYVQVQGGSVSIAKSYRISASYNSTASNWETLLPISSSGAFSSSDFEVEIKGTNAADSVRIRRTAGTASTTAMWELRLAHGSNTTFTEISSEDNPPTISATFREAAVAVVDNKVGINDIAPDEALDVNGKVRVQTLSNTPTTLVGRDGSNILGNAALSSELTIASGTLKLAQQSATSGQVLEWNGSAWAPGTDDGGGGSPAGANYQVQYYNGGSFGAEANFNYDPTNDRLVVGHTTAAGTIHARGSSTTVGAHYVGENSSGEDVFKSNNNGTVQLGNNESYPRFFPSATTGGSISLTGTGVTLEGQADATSGTDIFGVTHVNNTITSGTFNVLKSAGTFSPTSGSATYAGFRIEHIINQTGGANGIARGVYINPTLTAASDYRGVETNVASGTTRWGYYGAGTADSYFGGKVQVETLGSTTTALVGRNASKELSSTTLGTNIALTSGTLDVLGGVTSPSQITSDQDNYSPANWSTSTTARVSGDGTIRAITGFAALADGVVRRIVNIGSAVLYIPGEHPDSDAANRVAASCDNILAPNGGMIEIYYDGTSSRWRVTNNTFLASEMMSDGVTGHYYNESAGSTVAADWGAMGLATASGGNGQTAPTSALPGGWDINTATSASGVATLYYADGLTNPVEIGSAHIVTSCVVYFPTLSDGTQTYTFQFGIIPSPTSTTLAVNNSVAIRYSSGINSGKFEGFSRGNGGSESTADLGVTVAANTNYVLTVCYDKARSEARFYVNGAFAGRVTGNMPNATDAGTRAGIFKSAGTTSRSASVASMMLYTVY